MNSTEKRLRRVFRDVIALAAAAAPPVVYVACSTGDSTISQSLDGSISSADGAGSDSSAPPDSNSTDSALDAFVDSPPDPCAPIVIDGGLDADKCGSLSYAPCGIRADATSGCVPTDCSYYCSDFWFSCSLLPAYCNDGSAVTDGSPVFVDCVTCNNNPGRRHRGFQPCRARTDTSLLARFFAEAAYYERAAVLAFGEIAADLEVLGAPQVLRVAARRATTDERKHSKEMAKIARGFGAKRIARPRRASQRARRRSLEAFARHNAIEGCVRETFAAIVATWQSNTASSSAIRRTMRSIASDETRHAALSWDIASWAAKGLSTSSNDRIRDCFAKAMDQLSSELTNVPREIHRVAGMPSLVHQRALLAAMQSRMDEELDRLSFQ